jgi:hypothetical protein
MNIIYFDQIPDDILFVILDNIEKELTYPLLFVSKKLNTYITNKKIVYDKKYFIDYIVELGSLNLVKWFIENGYQWTISTCSRAAKNGYLDILKWAKENGSYCNSDLSIYAAENGHLEILTWTKENGFYCDLSIYAALMEYPEFTEKFLTWIKENSCEQLESVLYFVRNNFFVNL